MRVFDYPKGLHTRSEKPPPYRSLPSYRPYVRREFADRCVYCRAPNYPERSGSYSIDHYRPKHLFRELEWHYANLYWACHACNSRKGLYWPVQENLEATEFIPNPCDHRMFEHLKFEGLHAATKTRAGAKAVEVLDLNSDQHKRLRGALQTIADTFDATQKSLRAALVKVEARALASGSAEIAEVFERKRAKLLENIATTSLILDKLAAK